MDDADPPENLYREDLYLVASLLLDLDRVLNPLPPPEPPGYSIEPALPPALPSSGTAPPDPGAPPQTSVGRPPPARPIEEWLGPRPTTDAPPGHVGHWPDRPAPRGPEPPGDNRPGRTRPAPDAAVPRGSASVTSDADQVSGAGHIIEAGADGAPQPSIPERTAPPTRGSRQDPGGEPSPSPRRPPPANAPSSGSEPGEPTTRPAPHLPEPPSLLRSRAAPDPKVTTGPDAAEKPADRTPFAPPTAPTTPTGARHDLRGRGQRGDAVRPVPRTSPMPPSRADGFSRPVLPPTGIEPDKRAGFRRAAPDSVADPTSETIAAGDGTEPGVDVPRGPKSSPQPRRPIRRGGVVVGVLTVRQRRGLQYQLLRSYRTRGLQR